MWSFLTASASLWRFWEDMYKAKGFWLLEISLETGILLIAFAILCYLIKLYALAWSTLIQVSFIQFFIFFNGFIWIGSAQCAIQAPRPPTAEKLKIHKITTRPMKNWSTKLSWKEWWSIHENSALKKSFST